MNRLTVLLLSLLLFSLSGCVGLGKLSQLPPELQMKEVARTDAASPFTVSRAGRIAAVHEEGIEVISPQGQVARIAAATPTMLSFSPNGNMLVAALPAAAGTTLRIFDLNGKVMAEATVPERVTAVAWRDNTHVAAAALNIKRFSFGTLLTSTFYDWDNSGSPVATTLNSVTIRPQLAKLPDALLLNTLNLAVSPYNDEIAYSVLKDPPLFPPYQAIITRHIGSGAEQEVTRTSIGSGGPVYASDGDSLVVGDSQSVTRLVTIPDGRELNGWPAQGSYPAISRSGHYLFLDGHLYRDGQTFATFPRQSRAEFLPDGSGLVIAYEKRLYLVSGLNDQEGPKKPANLPRLLELRKLRSEGLITEKEYRAQRERLKEQPKGQTKGQRKDQPK
ncbi:MAG TPA: SHOCT domain-containing protein [Geomonas sp.]|nr:SHOCT domain-containing protein [Geomonas sp.]